MIVTLVDGTSVSIPDLTEQEIERIYTMHAAFLEREENQEEKSQGTPFDSILSGLGGSSNTPFSMSFGLSDGISTAMQHNPTQSEMPELPPEILEKVSTLSKIVSPDEIAAMPDPIEGCNCLYCQVTRTIKRENAPQFEEGPGPIDELIDDDIPEEELKFDQWMIEEVEDNLYVVKNKLDPHEEYRVFLGEPCGCTCGEKHCEHIVAVLKS